MERKENEELSLKELLNKIRNARNYLLSKWLYILMFGLLGSVLGLTYAWMKTPTYTATTTFVLEAGESSGGGMAQYAGIASMVGIDLGGNGGGIFQGDNILELYKSRNMIAKTLLSEVNINGKQELLINHYIDINHFRESWAEKPELKNVNFSKDLKFGLTPLSRVQDSLLNAFVKIINKKNLQVAKPDKKLSIIRVDVKSEDELFSKAFNDQIVANVNDFYIQTRTKKSQENINILAQKVDSVRAVMNGAIYASAAVSDATPNLNPTRQSQRAAPMQRSQFSAETNKAILGELVKNLEMSKMTLLKTTPLIQIVDNPNLPLEKEKPGRLLMAIVGGFIFTFIALIYFLVKLFFRNILA